MASPTLEVPTPEWSRQRQGEHLLWSAALALNYLGRTEEYADPDIRRHAEIIHKALIEFRDELLILVTQYWVMPYRDIGIE